MIINLLIRQQAQANAIPNKHFINTIIFDGKIGDDKKKPRRMIYFAYFLWGICEVNQLCG